MDITVSFSFDPLVMLGITALGTFTLALGEFLGAMYVAFWMPTDQRWEVIDFVECFITETIGKMALGSLLVAVIVRIVVHSNGMAALWTALVTAVLGFLFISYGMSRRH